MLWKSERAVVEELFDAPPAPERLDGTLSDEAYPTPGEVFHEVLMTLAATLTLALVVNLLLDVMGL